MVTINERLNAEKAIRHPGLLGERVGRDMEEALKEYGSADGAGQRKTDVPVSSLAYSIPMAGVRYYTFAP